MPLSDLPREILLDIADHLGDAGTSALARTNRCIYDFLNRYLYRQDLTNPESRSLLWGVRHGLEGTVQQAIASSRHLDPIPNCYHMALQIATEQGYVHLVELLLGVNGIDPNYETYPPLVIAAERGHSTVVELLLSTAKVDPNVRSVDGETALHVAAREGHGSIVKQLLARNDVDLNAVGGHLGRTALMEACDQEGALDVVKLFLEKEDIDINQQSSVGWYSALSLAVGSNNLKVAELLLDQDDIDPNLKDRSGRTALCTACCENYLSMVELLLENDNVDPNVRDNSQRTPLVHAYNLNHLDVAFSLLSHNDTVIDQEEVNIREALIYLRLYSGMD